MNEKQSPTSERVYRELTEAEQKWLDAARAETDAQRDAIVEEGRLRKAGRNGRRF